MMQWALPIVAEMRSRKSRSKRNATPIRRSGGK
jgi:hypothetical protein